MNTEEVKNQYGQYMMPTYRASVVIAKAKGSRVYDANGKQYYDMTSGIGVHNVGHCTEGVVAAVQEQVAKLGHCSNLFINEPQVRLAKKLVEISDLGGRCSSAIPARRRTRPRSSLPASGARRTAGASRW